MDWRIRAGWPTHSNAKSTPFGQISFTASTVSTSGPAAMKWVAPNWRAAASFAGLVSTAMIGSASLRAQALDDVEADAADADHHGGLAVGRLGPVEHRADAGEHRAADEAGRGERHVRVDHDGLRLLHDGVLGEHAGVGELERLARRRR